MTIKVLPGDHLYLSCDTEGCKFEGPTLHGVTEEELLDFAESKGWNIDREFGLHYCPLTERRSGVWSCPGLRPEASKCRRNRGNSAWSRRSDSSKRQ